MKMTKKQIAGWILSFLVAAFLIFASALGKFTEWEGKAKMFAELGWSESLLVKVGIVEVILAVMLILPRTGFLGVILLTGYLGGATATHVRVGQPFYFPIIVGVLAWIAFGLRRPEVFCLALGREGSGGGGQ